MNTGMVLLVITVLTALIFDFLNGFHDAANSIATVVSTRVLSPRLAVAWAAAFNFLAAFLLGTAVAKTIGKGMIQLDIVTQYVVHRRIGRRHRLGPPHLVMGTPHLVLARPHRRIRRSRHGPRRHLARLVAPRPHVIIASGWTKTLIFIVVAPLMGFVIGFGMMVAVSWIFQHKVAPPG